MASLQKGLNTTSFRNKQSLIVYFMALTWLLRSNRRQLYLLPHSFKVYNFFPIKIMINVQQFSTQIQNWACVMYGVTGSNRADDNTKTFYTGFVRRVEQVSGV